MDFQLVVRGCHFHALYTPEIVRNPWQGQCAPMQPHHDATLRAILNQSSTRPGALMQLSAEASARIRSANEGNELAEPAAHPRRPSRARLPHARRRLSSARWSTARPEPPPQRRWQPHALWFGRLSNEDADCGTGRAASAIVALAFAKPPTHGGPCGSTKDQQLNQY
jgi:hypothetical protein